MKKKVQITDVLRKPVMTEKSMLLSGNELAPKNVVVFEVDPRANKTLIAQAMTIMFNVRVVSVNTKITGGTIHDRGKQRRKSGEGRKKVAIIKLKEGDFLDRGVI